MLDIKWIRENPKAFVTGLTDRGFDDPQGTLTQILKLDEQRRETIQKLQAAQARRNTISKEIGQAKAGGNDDWAETLKEEVAQLKTAIQEGEDQEREDEAKFHKALSEIPNIPAADVPVGLDADSNVELREVGKKPKFKFEPKQHFELGEALGLMDFETAAKLSGARFVVLKGPLARLERALAQFMLDLHTTEHGYTEINPPLLVRDDPMFGTAQLPKFKDDQFATHGPIDPDDWVDFVNSLAPHDEYWECVSGPTEKSQGTTETKYRLNRDGLILCEEFRAAKNRYWLIPTAEVPLTNLVREDIVDEASLPLRVTAWTPCFRAEAGAAGKDTRGMIRQHQFSKVELVSITTPEQSAKEHERMTAAAEEVLKLLEIPYRVVTLSTGDMGFAARKTYDIEVWLPGENTYREISSCSVCGDFQARRMNARYKPKGGKETRFVHTLNGSGLAVGRTLIAVLENYQQADGSVVIPEALRPYMGGLAKIEKAA